MQNMRLETAQDLYRAMGREAAINFTRAMLRDSSTKALEEIVDFINYVADMADGADR